MWRDPLDELIEDLGRTLPPERKPAEINWSASLVGLQFLMHAQGRPEELARLEQDPNVRAFRAQNEAWLRQINSDRQSAAHDKTAEQQEDPTRP